jgi:hypothetical protein
MQGGDARFRRVLARAWWQRGDPVRPTPRPEPGTRRTRPRGPASPRRGRRWTRWRAGCRGGVAPPARGWSRGDGLGASSRRVLPPPWSPTGARKGAWPRVPWRHQRRPGHDVRQGVMPLACFGRSVPQRCGPPLGSRATGSRRGAGGPLSAVGLPARLWSPGVRLGSLARPPADRLAGQPRQDGPSPRAQPQLPGLARPCPHRQTATPGGWNACTSRTVPREGPRVHSTAGFGPRCDDGTTNVMLQDGKPRRATGGGQPATADPATHCSYGARP